MMCASCGTDLPVSALFCPGCGQRVTTRREMAAMPARSAQPVPMQAAPRAMPATNAPPIPRGELTAALHAREELGERLEDEVVDSFLDRVERAIDSRVDARLQGRLPMRRGGSGETDVGGVWLALGSLGMGIPLTAIAASASHLPGIIAVWAGIAIVNSAYNKRRKD